MPCPWPVYFWFRSQCDSLGSVPTQTATVRCLATGEDFEITLTANCIPRPSVAVELAFDRLPTSMAAAGRKAHGSGRPER